MPWFFVFFFISGFCSILYEVVWLRLCMAEFGVNTALVSIVLSMFMAGLGLGSWLSGELFRRYGRQLHFPMLRLYALAELLIGISALAVPHELRSGRTLLEAMGFSSSVPYYLASGVWVAISIVPWCALMGATIPIAMEAIRRSIPQEQKRSFSFLYLANVGGAVLGTFLPLGLIELFGFRGTLNVGAILNSLLAIGAIVLSHRVSVSAQADLPQEVSTPDNSPAYRPQRILLALLFLTGLTSMGLEVAWIREFTPYEGTVVYAFATILGIYLGGTFVGSRIYRYWSRKRTLDARIVWAMLAVSALLAPVASNADFHMSNLLRVILGIAPFTTLVGLLTPMLVDRWSGGDPAKAGSAYAVNVVGCILGPLVAGFVLLPMTSERWTVFVLAMPLLAYGLYAGLSSAGEGSRPTFSTRLASYALLPLAAGLVFASKNYEQQRHFPENQVLRDHTATIIAAGSGMRKILLVNGIGITVMTPITKMMAHMPMAMQARTPHNALVICFGMGTTYRSMMSWNVPVTAVELVPSVPRMFWYFHPDGAQLLRSPLSHVVIDDGRRYLEREPTQYDAVVLDPPPPVEAAGSSLLYSKEFYSAVKRRLSPDGLLQQWIPGGDRVALASVARALKESFPYVYVFRSIAGWGFHFIASERPLPGGNVGELVRRMPATAVADMMEWGPEATPEAQFQAVLGTQLSIDQLIALAPNAPALTDDRPLNEYYLLRREFLPKPWMDWFWGKRSDAPLTNRAAQ